jgi:hypothetical protein
MFNRQNVGRRDRLVQKIALTAVDQADNSNLEGGGCWSSPLVATA